MKILVTGLNKAQIIDFLRNDGNEVIDCGNMINMQKKVDYIILNGYTNNISLEVFRKYENKIINLFTSYLPYNRGYYPNLFSFVNDTPKGVSIQLLKQNKGVGSILFRKKIEFNKHDTLISSEEKMRHAALELFYENWNLIKSGRYTFFPQEVGTYHSKKEGMTIMQFLPRKWNTPISEIQITLKNIFISV